MPPAHEHTWILIDSDFVIDTSPPQYPYECECGAFSHNPETGEPCPICRPSDPRLIAETAPAENESVGEVLGILDKPINPARRL